jgi:hypothetical protein
MIDWLLGMPWMLLMILIVGGFAGFGLLGLSLTRRFILPRLGHSRHQTEITATIVHGILIIYGLAVALLAVAVWEKYAEATRTVSAEAAAIAALYRDVSAYAEPVRTRLRRELKAYTEYTVREAWPIQRHGRMPEGGIVVMDRFQDELQAYQPTTFAQLAHHQQTLDAYNTLIQNRRLRLEFVTTGLPAPMWAVILFGALITLASAFFLDLGEGGNLNRFLIVTLSAVMGLLVFMVATYDQPLRGSHGISPDAYEVVYQQLMGK